MPAPSRTPAAPPMPDVAAPAALFPTDALARLVDHFYAAVRADALLGPVFADAVEDWPQHQARLTDFWSSVMTTSGRYKGNPVAAHAAHANRISPEMFNRWLELWAKSTRETMPPEAAAALQAKAARIAISLKLALYFRLPARAGA